MFDDSDDSFPIDFARLLTAAAREILRHEDPQQFRQWLYQNMNSFIIPGNQELMPADGWRALATVLGIEIWNATPLPGNRFQTKPLPRPGRNDRCPCGSGQKFKRCCGGAPPFAPLSARMMWSFVLDGLSRADLARALQKDLLPTAAVIAHTMQLIEDGHPARAVKVLAPLFEGDLNRRNSEDDEHALDLLLDAYDELGHTKKKQILLAHITSDAKRSPLRAGAWQRLASIRMDENDSPGAWEAFERAQRDQPNAPALAQLEILLLSSDGRIDEIPARARLWIRRFRRQKFEGVDDLLDWLREVAEDPEDVLTELGIRSSDNEGQLLRQWLKAVRERAVCAYAVADADRPVQPTAPSNEELRSTLQGMGIASGQIGEMIESLQNEIGRAGTDDAHELADGMQGPESLCLAVPAGVRDMQRQWHDVFPCAKPFSTQDEPFDDDPWYAEKGWVAFLERHPQAYDSVDILDDLATAVVMHPLTGELSFTEQMLVPILERAVSIVELSLANANVPAPRLAWIVVENRPMLRAYARLALWKLQRGDTERALALAERVCTLNPHDNHGLRCMLMDEYLRAARDDDAVALAARYPDDIFAETRFGNVLALYRLQRVDAARAALGDAAADLPQVLRYLLAKRIRQPKIDDEFDMSGDAEEQAWIYRQQMRSEWERTPGALDWLKKSSRALR